VFDDLELFQTWDRDYYHPLARPLYDRLVQRMVWYLACPPGQTILDAGCGPGEHSIRVAREGYHVQALDISATVLEEARRRAQAAGVEDRITFLQGDLTRLNLSNESCQAIFSWGVIIHIRPIEKALDELVRVLRPKGRLALYVTNKAALDHWILRAGRRILGKTPVPSYLLPMGRGCWHETGADRLWVWHIHIPALIEYLEGRNMTLVARTGGQFTELQRRVNGALRSAMLWGNRAYNRLHLPARFCADNLLVFEKHA